MKIIIISTSKHHHLVCVASRYFNTIQRLSSLGRDRERTTHHHDEVVQSKASMETVTPLSPNNPVKWHLYVLVDPRRWPRRSIEVMRHPGELAPSLAKFMISSGQSVSPRIPLARFVATRSILELQSHCKYFAVPVARSLWPHHHQLSRDGSGCVRVLVVLDRLCLRLSLRQRRKLLRMIAFVD